MNHLEIDASYVSLDGVVKAYKLRSVWKRVEECMYYMNIIPMTIIKTNLLASSWVAIATNNIL